MAGRAAPAGNRRNLNEIDIDSHFWRNDDSSNRVHAVYVCLCNGITEADIREAAAGGCGSMPELTMRTGCGASCGSCVEMASELLEAHRARPAVSTGNVIALPVIAHAA